MQPETVIQDIRTDLTASVEGEFSSEDWGRIVELAHQKLRTAVAQSDIEPQVAWQNVVRDFYQSKFWGFKPGPRERRVRPAMNLGVKFVLLGLNTMITFKIAVIWFGQKYTNSEDDPWALWIFVGVILLVLCNYGYFLYSATRSQSK